MSLQAQEAVRSLFGGPGRNLLPHTTSCHVKLPHTAPSYRNLSQLPAATWQDATWHPEAGHQTPGRSCPSTVTREFQPRCASNPGPRSGVDKSVPLPTCRYSCHFRGEYFQQSLPPRKRAPGCSGHEKTSGSGPGTAGLLRTLPRRAASQDPETRAGDMPTPTVAP